jgi:CRP/FNR family cyclic AMP-dependent transcriptional regulator
MADATLDEDYVHALAALGTARSYAKNTIVFQEGDLSDQVYVVVSGKVKVFLADSDGKEVIVDILGPRQYFGEMALDGRPRSASVITLEASKLAIVQREQYKHFLSENPDAAFGLIVTLIGRARNLTRAVGSMGLLDVYGRVARLLLDNAVERDGQTVLRERMTHQEIAKRVGASREMVTRILGDLREGGYVAIEDELIVIRQTPPERW